MKENTSSPKNLFIIELSEFNVDLLTQGAQLYDLPHLSKILQFKKSSYKTNDRSNSGYLTPAIQWNAIHKGISTRRDGANVKFCWEILKDQQISVSISNLDANSTLIAPIEAFPSFFKRIQIHCILLKQAFKLKCTFNILKEILRADFKKSKDSELLANYLNWLDFISVLLFIKQKTKQHSQLSIISLKSLGLCQLQHWKSDEKQLSAELKYALKTLDKLLGRLMNSFAQESFIMHNALSQIKVPNATTQTGQYVPLGTIYSQDVHFPNHIFNYEFNNYIYNYFLPQSVKLKSEYIEDEVLV